MGVVLSFPVPNGNHERDLQFFLLRDEIVSFQVELRVLVFNPHHIEP